MPEPIRFPDIELYQGWGHPMRAESDIRDLEVAEGEVPAALNGRLYRVGADRQYPSMFKDDIFIDGEGMIHCFTFTDGHVDYKSRWSRNERFLLQEAARRSLFGRYRNRYTNDPSVEGKSMGTANTNAIWHGKRLLILKEDSLPFEVDPDTLDPIGLYDYGGDYDSVSMSAHPKMDYHNNEMITFSYQAQGDATTDFCFYIIGADGTIAHRIPFHMPYAAMVHDFAMTESHLIVPFFPLITTMEVIKSGGPYYQWHPDKECHVAIVPRRGTPDEIRWFKGPACSAGHMMNAFNEGDMLHLDLCLYEGNCFPFFPSADGSPYVPAPPLLSRMSFNLADDSGSFERRPLGPVACEMPQIDERLNGKPYTYGYTICYEPPRRTSRLGKWNIKTGELKIWDPGPDSAIQEAKFVPYGPGEEEGYLIVPVNRVAEMRSDIAILDAADIEAGPVALIKMPIRIKASFHGQWVPNETLESGLFNYP